MNEKVLLLQNIATKLRINCITSTNESKSGHPTSCSSIAEIMAVLFFDEMKYYANDPQNASNDRIILSKGHAAPILYAAWAEAGFLKEDELLTLRKINSDLEGHPTPRLKFVDVATGSLGQGLSNAVGMAYVGKYIDEAAYRVYCIIGDGESCEGSIWEALAFASFYSLDNIVAIFDINRLGQSQGTMLQHDLETYRMRLEAFGWHSIVIDGHDVSEILKAFSAARSVSNRPVAIVAKTWKGHDFPGLCDKDNWHGKPLGNEAGPIIEYLQQKMHPLTPFQGKLQPKTPIESCEMLSLLGTIKFSSPPAYKIGDSVATRLAYGKALARLGSTNPRVIGLDGDTKNSTYSILLRDLKPKQFIECFIAEQNLVGVAIGCATRQRTVPFVSTFGAFFTRAFDQIRMGSISMTNCNFCGSHAGVSIGEDGPSQMALEDIAMFRSVQGSTVFYPSDAVSTEWAVEIAANRAGVCYIRTSRPNTPVIYSANEVFEAGKGKVVLTSGSDDDVVVIGAGVTLFEAMKAGETLKSEGIRLRVIDLFTIKPIDADLIISSARAAKGRVITVEDHAPEGGLGEAVAAVLSQADVNFRHRLLAVRELPRSGPGNELMKMFRIDASAISAEARTLSSMSAFTST